MEARGRPNAVACSCLACALTSAATRSRAVIACSSTSTCFNCSPSATSATQARGVRFGPRRAGPAEIAATHHLRQLPAAWPTPPLHGQQLLHTWSELWSWPDSSARTAPGCLRQGVAGERLVLSRRWRGSLRLPASAALTTAVPAAATSLREACNGPFTSSSSEACLLASAILLQCATVGHTFAAQCDAKLSALLRQGKGRHANAAQGGD